MTVNLVDRFGRERADVLAMLDPRTTRVGGSSVYLHEGGWQDVDVFVESERDFSVLVGLGARVGIHPTRIPPGAAQRLHELMSFYNFCMTLDLSGNVYAGENLTDEALLQFNPASKEVFPSCGVVSAIAKKYMARGYGLVRSELPKAAAILTGEPQHLGHALLAAGGRPVLEAIGRNSAIVAGGFFRTMLMGQRPKDIDIYTVGKGHYESLCEDLSAFCAEVPFIVPESMKKLRVRKFRPEGSSMSLDVIDYSFVQLPEHVIETFDYQINCLWYDPRDGLIKGTQDYPARAILQDILARRLRVMKNAWFKGGALRALSRWQRFHREGFTPGHEDVALFGRHVRMMMGRHA